MRKIISIFLGLLLVAGNLAGCGNNNIPVDDTKLKIVTTIFPQYDWVREIVGSNEDNVDLTLLMDTGVDLHSYQPTADDIIKISNCDIFIYVGGESDKWVENALREAVNKDMVVINLLETLGDGAKKEEVVQGMQAEEHNHGEEAHEYDEESHDHDEEEHAHDDEDQAHDEEDHNHDEEDHDHDEDGHHHGEDEYDEHIWLSLKNAKILCNIIADKLVEIDSKNKDSYTANVSSYTEKLSILDESYQDVVNNNANKTLLFGDRFPFRYLVDDYGLTYYAAFVGCSAETEASFETIAFLAEKVDELDLSYVLTIEGAKHKIAETVISNTKNKDQQILLMDSLQSVTANDVKNGTTYLLVMERNLEVLKDALK